MARRPASDSAAGRRRARATRPREGHRLIREAYEHNTRLGMRAGASEVLGYAAEALLLAGDVDGAQAQLREALQIADELGEGVYLPQLLLLQAAIARAQARRRVVQGPPTAVCPEELGLEAREHLVAEGGVIGGALPPDTPLISPTSSSSVVERPSSWKRVAFSSSSTPSPRAGQR